MALTAHCSCKSPDCEWEWCCVTKSNDFGKNASDIVYFEYAHYFSFPTMYQMSRV